MADTRDVEAALAAAVRAVRDASFATGIVGIGWPSSSELAAAQRVPMVTVWQAAGYTRNTTRYPPREYLGTATPVSLTATVAGNVATFAGTCSTDQIAGVQVGTTAWAVRCGGTDTPASVAASLAALSGGTANGAALTLTGLLAARTGRDVPAFRTTRQQEMRFSVIVWTSDPDSRDTVAGAIDAALSDVEFLTLADGSAARLTWAGSTPIDRAQDSDLYRRDLHYAVDFATTRISVRTPTLFPGATYAPGSLRIGALHS